MTKTVTTMMVCFLFGALAHANPKSRPEKTEVTAAKKVGSAATKELVSKTPPTKTFDFTPDDIDGDRIAPDNTTVFGIVGVKHRSLIRVREHFLSEIVRSADDL